MSEDARRELERLRGPIPEGEAIDLTEVITEWGVENPEDAVLVETLVEDSREADRVYAMSLATVRAAFGRTQVEVAQAMGTAQGHISRIERNGDLLISTLLSYLHAGGIEGPILLLVKSPAGKTIEVDLDAILAEGRKSLQS